jgi:hypothetical protein
MDGQARHGAHGGSAPAPEAARPPRSSRQAPRPRPAAQPSAGDAGQGHQHHHH